MSELEEMRQLVAAIQRLSDARILFVIDYVGRSHLALFKLGENRGASCHQAVQPQVARKEPPSQIFCQTCVRLLREGRDSAR